LGVHQPAAEYEFTMVKEAQTAFAGEQVRRGWGAHDALFPAGQVNQVDGDFAIILEYARTEQATDLEISLLGGGN
jgi:hypothetical protein